MEECTAKLFRTAYGCKLISEELHKAEKEGKLTKSMSESEKLHIYDLANLAVAKKLNHQRALPKNFDAQMEKLDEKVEAAIKKESETKAKAEKDLASILEQANLAKKEWEGEKLEQALARIKERKDKIAEKVEKSEKKLEELKTKREFKGMTACYSLTTSRTNYSTPSLAVGFCKKFGIDIGKIYSKSLLKKFNWALETPESYYTKFPKESFGDE
jgi:DNA topoisomerase-1